MVASLREGRKDLVAIPSLGIDTVRVAAIYGANAAGKSNVLAALDFLRDAVVRSHRLWKPEGPIPLEPFALGSTVSTPSRIEVDLFLEGSLYEYGIELSSERVVREWLYAYPQRRRQLWFLRNANSEEESFSFGKQLRGNNRTISELTRANSLFLSVAAANNHTQLAPLYRWFSDSLLFAGPDDWRFRVQYTTRLFSDGAKKTQLLTLLRKADLGIVDLEISRKPLNDRAREVLQLLASQDSSGEREIAVPENLPELRFRHSSPHGATLSFEEESRGTRFWFALTGPILAALQTGSTLCVDELDASLHPHLSAEILRLFQDPESNPNNAQLVFTTHDTSLFGSLLGPTPLHRDQIWFVEKDKEGATKLYPLTDFRPRKEENVERGYLQGRYGAIPFIDLRPSAVEDKDPEPEPVVP